MEFGTKNIRGFQYARIGYLRSDFPKARKRVGAAYIEGSRIIIAANEMKTSPLANRCGSRYSRNHAEMNCLQGISDASGGELYVYREHGDGTLAMARPCEYCLPLLLQHNVRHVYYTQDGGYAYIDLRTL